MQREHLEAHTGIRGIAAALVALLHMHYEDLMPPQFWEPFMRIATGWYPVDVFFMLSGFILGYVYIADIRKPHFNYKKYLVKRFARVAPLHYLTMLGAGIMALVALYLNLPNRGYHLSDILPQLLMVHAYPYIGHGGWNGPSWSISMEFFGYIFLFPLILILVARSGKKYILLLLYFFILAAVWALEEHANQGWPAVMRITCHFSIGYILYALSSFRNPILEFASKFVSLWLFLAIGWLFTRSYFDQGTIRMLFQIIFSLLILGTSSNKRSLAHTVLSNKVFMWLGICSYSIYMIHNLIGKVIHVYVDKIPEEPSIRVLIVLGSYIFLLFSSWMTYKLFEIPSRNYLTNKLIRKKSNK